MRLLSSILASSTLVLPAHRVHGSGPGCWKRVVCALHAVCVFCVGGCALCDNSVSLEPSLGEAHGSICDRMGLEAHLSLSACTGGGLEPTHGSSGADRAGCGAEQGCSPCGETVAFGGEFGCATDLSPVTDLYLDTARSQ